MARFRHVDLPVDIPDTWWFKVEMAELRPKAPQYRADPSGLGGQPIFSVCVGEVEPLYSRRISPDNRFFDTEARVVQILSSFISTYSRRRPSDQQLFVPHP